MSEKSKKLIGGIVAAALVLAYFTKPTKADFESYVDNQFENAQSQALKKGEILSWLFGKGVGVVRGGKYESGILTSTYYVTIAGEPIAKCTGMFGGISCSKAEK